MPRIHTVFASAGCGKTEFCTTLAADFIARRVCQRDQILYTTFQKTAAADAARRAGITGEAARGLWYRTLHSACLKLLRIPKGNIITPAKMAKFGERMGVEIASDMAVEDDEEADLAQAMLGLQRIRTLSEDSGGIISKLIATYQLSRLTAKSVEDLRAARHEPSPYAMRYFGGVDSEAYASVVESYENWKGGQLVDFVDFLEKVVLEPVTLPNWKAVFVDEAQDLSGLQLLVLDKLSQGAENVFYAGDDWQCLPGDEPILTTNGVLPIAEVVVGHLVLASKWDGTSEFRAVRETKPRKHKGRLIQFTTESGRRVRVTPRHHLFIRYQWKKEDPHAYSEKVEAWVASVGDKLPCISVSGAPVWERIERVEDVEFSGLVYDLEVEGLHNFCAGGIFVSNCIMGFQGASADGFLSLRSKARKIHLPQTHRFGQSIIDLGTQIASRLPEGEPKTILPMPGKHNPIRRIFDVEEASDYPGSKFYLHRHREGCNAIARKLITEGKPFWCERGVNPLGKATSIAGYLAIKKLMRMEVLDGVDMKSLLGVIGASKDIRGDRIKLMKRGSHTLLKRMDPTQTITPLELSGHFTEILWDRLRAEDWSLTDVTFADYYKSLGEGGFELGSGKEPEITISTIHGSKGRDAESVFVWDETLPKCMTDAGEHRVGYVAVTRTKGPLYIVSSPITTWNMTAYPYLPDGVDALG